jgi:ABC-type microcin C transport system duplicated ATPase subunit YejF
LERAVQANPDNALMGLLPETVRVAHGRILLEGIDLLTLPPEDLYGVRGRRIAIFQGPCRSQSADESLALEV